MKLNHFFKSAFIGIKVAVLVLVIGVAGEMAWLALGLPGVQRMAAAPATNVRAGTPHPSGVIATTFYDRSETITESYVDVSLVPSYILAAVGLGVGFWMAYRRPPTRTGS